MRDELLWGLVVVSRIGFRGQSRDIDLICLIETFW